MGEIQSSIVSTSLGISYISGLQTALDAKQALTNALQWQKITVAHTALQTAGLTNNITLFTLSPQQMIHDIVMKHTAAFTGGAIATYTLSIGIAGSLTKYVGLSNVFQAPSSTLSFRPAAALITGIEDFSSSVAVKISAISTVANLNASTAGSVDVYVLTSLLP